MTIEFDSHLLHAPKSQKTHSSLTRRIHTYKLKAVNYTYQSKSEEDSLNHKKESYPTVPNRTDFGFGDGGIIIVIIVVEAVKVQRGEEEEMGEMGIGDQTSQQQRTYLVGILRHPREGGACLRRCSLLPPRKRREFQFPG